MILKVALLSLGFIILLFGTLKPSRKKGDIITIIIGGAYVILGAFVSDPLSQWQVTLTQSDIMLALSLLSGSYIVSRVVNWAIVRSELYKKTITALDAVKKIEDVANFAKSLDEMYKKVHKEEL